MALAPDRFFDLEPSQRSVARDLYSQIKDLPLVSPHGHVDPALFISPDVRFDDPVALLVQPDHYVIRMLVSQGIPLDQLLAKDNPREIWRMFAEHFYLFRATPSGIWLTQELEELFSISEKLNANSADHLYDQLDAALKTTEFSPRALFERFNIDVLATTDAATDTLEHHKAIRASGWKARIVPTFRPDGVVNINTAGWRTNLERLSAVSGLDVSSYSAFIQALEQRRAYFKQMGATATDSGVFSAATDPMSIAAAAALFDRALKGTATATEAAAFSAHMLSELARMSVDDGLVMQIHAGSFRNHNPAVFDRFGPDRGFDIPVMNEFTHSLKPLLDRFGNHPNFSLILFTLDETTYSRELAPLAGAYPSIKLGPPWWFYDSLNGMRRYFDQVVETTGLYNLAGFNDDTRAFPSIPARHDVWRRASANWLSGLVVRGIIDQSEAEEMAVDLAVGLAKRAYHLD